MIKVSRTKRSQLWEDLVANVKSVAPLLVVMQRAELHVWDGEGEETGKYTVISILTDSTSQLSSPLRSFLCVIDGGERSGYVDLLFEASHWRLSLPRL